MNKKCFVTTSEEETIDLGEKVGRYLRETKDTVALIGDLGTGKTTFTKGVARAFGIKDKIKSPTFVLLREYCSEYGKLVHVDAYRLESNFEDIGLSDYFGRDVVLIEWSDRLDELLPKEVKKIRFKNIDEKTREICLNEIDLI